MEMFELSSKGTVFESSEEVRLLHDAMETTHYVPVRRMFWWFWCYIIICLVQGLSQKRLI